MTLEYLRAVKLVVADSSGNGLDFGQFRVSFTVQRGDRETPNSLDARIYNLADNTANTISKNEFTQISLSAGYPGNLGLLFQGNIKQFRKGRADQKDSYVDITAADSDQAFNYAYMNQTLPAGTGQGTIADAILKSLQQHSGAQQITKGYAPKFPNNPSIRGTQLFGMTRDLCRRFANQNNCKWSLQSGALTFIPYTSFVPLNGPIPVISVATGLIGVPEQTQGGINIRILLNANIKVGQLIKLDSQVNQFRFGLDFNSQNTNGIANSDFNSVTGQTTPAGGLAAQIKTNPQGLYYVMTANHTGDTRGQNWYTDLVCLSADATLANNDPTQALFFTAPSSQVINRYGGT